MTDDDTRRAESRKRLEGEGWVFVERALGPKWLVSTYGPGHATTTFTSDKNTDAIDKALRYASMATMKRKASRR
jgi:hypothetical protein